MFLLFLRPEYSFVVDLAIFCAVEFPIKDDRFGDPFTDLQEQDEVEHRFCITGFSPDKH